MGWLFQSTDGRQRVVNLVVDSSICNTNSACVVNKAFPVCSRFAAAFPCAAVQLSLRLSLDIEAAHKTVRVRESDRGLLGIQMQVPRQPLRFFFYKVCPFGAWFQRVSGFLVRVLHQLFWVRHALLMYADNLLAFTEMQVIDLLASLALCFCQVFGYSVAWPKFQRGSSILWIGWQFNFLAGGVTVPGQARQASRWDSRAAFSLADFEK